MALVLPSPSSSISLGFQHPLPDRKVLEVASLCNVSNHSNISEEGQKGYSHNVVG